MKTDLSQQVILQKFSPWPLGDERHRQLTAKKKNWLTSRFSSNLFSSRQILALIEWIIFKVAFGSRGRALLLLHSTLISYSDLMQRGKKKSSTRLVFGSHCHQLFLPVTVKKNPAEYSSLALFPSLSLISSYFNYTTVIKQDISSGDQSLHRFRWPPCATPELSQKCWR